MLPYDPPKAKEVYLRLRVRDSTGYVEWFRSVRARGVVFVSYSQMPRNGVYLNPRLGDASMLPLLLDHSRSHPALIEFEQLTKKQFNELRAAFDKIPNLNPRSNKNASEPR